MVLPHEANCVYEDLDLALKAAGHDNMYVRYSGITSYLTYDYEKIQSLPAKKVHLAPFMIVARVIMPEMIWQGKKKIPGEAF
ncbi:MAG: hypothetical protein V8T31_10885 [Lachnospiraceae bacterium]